MSSWDWEYIVCISFVNRGAKLETLKEAQLRSEEDRWIDTATWGITW